MFPRVYIGMPFSAVLVRRTIQAILYYHILCKFVVRRFRAVRRDFIGARGKTPYRGIFARLVTNNIFVIIVTLIITFSI